MSVVFRWIAAGLLALSTACTQFPELDATQTPGVANAAYPDLVPLETLVNGPVPRATLAEVGRVQGRVGTLKARATRLKAMRVGPPSVANRLARLRQKAAALRAQ